MVRVPHLRTIAAGLAFGLLAGACTSDDQPPPPPGPTGNSSGMVAVAASVDLYRGDPQRVAFGLIMPDNSLVSFGTVDVAFSLVGSAAETGAAESGPTATAAFVPTFGTPDASSGPVVTSPTEGRGVYEATDVVFDTAGFWVADVTADIEGLGPQTAQATFAVLEHPELPAPGDEAPRTENLTVDSKGVPLAAIDWLQMRNGDLTEPWLFLIGADGRVVDRWSSMWSEAEVEAELEALPPMKAKR